MVKDHWADSHLHCLHEAPGPEFLSAREVNDDLGASWSFILDSPAAIAEACRKSVRRWRLARILNVIPSALPEGCDAKLPGPSGDTMLVDFTGLLHGLLNPHTARNANIPRWHPNENMPRDVASAISGGQWP